jgi:hypothetical protein
MPTKLLIQPIEETDAMNPHQITTSAPADDSRLLSLFRDWLELYRTAEGICDDREYDAARERFDAIATEAFAKVPAAGVAGIAIKAVLRLQIDPTGLKCLCPLETSILEVPLETSILEDAALLVPELAPLVAGMLTPGISAIGPNVVSVG